MTARPEPALPGAASARARLVATLVLAALLHAILILGVTFSAGRPGTAAAPGLDVLLVSEDLPDARANPGAHYAAQRSQHGAGNAARTRANPAGGTGPAGAGPDPATAPAAEPSPQAQDAVVLTSAPSTPIRYLGTLPSTPAEAAAGVDGPPRSGSDEMALELKGSPSAQRWVAPDTAASVLAPYLVRWKSKVERVGTLNFPTAARRSGLSGSPVVEVEIDADGHLRQAHVQRSSGYGALDDAALAIIRLASPFAPFPEPLASHYSALRFAYQYEFVAGEAGEAP